MERIAPREKWLYNDRGMMKWMAWLLSDHSAFMDAEKKQEQAVTMATEKFSIILKGAWERVKLVSIQLNMLEDDQFVTDIHGVILGYGEGSVTLQLDNGHTRTILVEEIRHVSLDSSEKC